MISYIIITSPSRGGGLLGLPIPSKWDAFLNKLLKDILLRSKSRFIEDKGEALMSRFYPCRKCKQVFSVLDYHYSPVMFETSAII